MSYYFFKTVTEKKETKVYPLPGQKFLGSGEEINPKLRVSCSKSVRDSKPIGSIFFSYSLYSIGKTHYKAGNIYYLNLTDKMSSPAVRAEYEKLMAAIPKEESTTEETTKEEVKEEIKEPTFFDEMAKIDMPTPNKEGFFVEKENWTLLLRNIKKHINTMIIGPTGTGKTSLIKLACEKLGVKLHVFDMGSIIDPISSLLGVHRLEDGKSVFDYANFTQAIQEPCVILLDELSRASYASNNILFPCLDDRRKLSIEVAGSKSVREINVHPEVTFIATANVGSEYTGTQSMDRALVNRFFPIELNYIPSNQEEKVLMHRTQITSDQAKTIVKIANTVRSLAEKQEISTSVSIRETLYVAELVKDGWNVGSSITKIFAPLYEGSKSTGERSIIYKTIASY